MSTAAPRASSVACDISAIKQGGVLALSSGNNLIDKPGAAVIMRNSSFEKNTAGLDNGAVANVEKFASILVEGDGNVFEGNKCGEDGGVFASTTNTMVTIEGGTVNGNSCDGVSHFLGARHPFFKKKHDCYSRPPSVKFGLSACGEGWAKLQPSRGAGNIFVERNISA